jgi:tight adherence protein C
MTQILYFLISVASFSAAMAAFVFFLMRHEKAQLAKRSAAVVNPHLRALEERAGSSVRALVGFSYIVHSIRLRLGIADSNRIRVRLSAAGFYDAHALDMYVGIRVLLPVAAVALVSFFTTGFAIILGVASAGYLIPDFVLERLVKKRRNKIRRSLPDTVDLLVICMDAGLGVDQAVQRTAGVLDIAYPDLCNELLHLGRLRSLGDTRVQAWKKLVARTKSEDIEQIANMLFQAEKFGTPISESMHVLADSLRMQRKQRAEERAARSSITLLIPLVCFIFPVIFVVLLGPAVIAIIRGFSAFGQ